MGIRCHCPNGHRLNIKSFQAGKRGVCPHCGAKFKIPLESQFESSRSSDRGKLSSNEQAAGNKASSDDVTAVGSKDASVMVASEVPVDRSSVTGTNVQLGSEDPFETAPDAVWYVRVPSGEQYGPANSDTMKQWVAEGRISAQSYIWREGWANWDSADNIFGSLASPDAQLDKPRESSLSIDVVADPTRISRRSESASPATRRTRPNKKTIQAVVILGIASIILLIGLVFVIVSSMQ